MIKRYLPYILLILTTLFWSGNFVLSKGINQIIHPIALGFWRWLIAGLILLPFSYSMLIKQRHLIKKHFLYFNFLGFLGITSFNILIYFAMHYTTAINAVLVNSFVPIMILVVSLAVYKEKPMISQIFGILISILGIFSIMLKGNLFAIFELSFNIGDILVFVAGLTWAIYTVLLRSLPKDIHPLLFLESIIILGLIYLLPMYLFELYKFGGFQPDIKIVVSIGYVAIFASVLAFIFWNKAVKDVGAAKAGPFIHLMPIFGALLASIFLDEKLQLYHVAGISLVFIGIFIVNRK